MIKMKTMLGELRVIDLAKSKESDKPTYFMVYKDKLFILDDESPIKTHNARLKTHVKGHPAVDPQAKWGPLKARDVEGFLIGMSEMSPDIVVGRYFPERKEIIVWDLHEVQPKSSLNVKKVVNQLGIKTVRYYHRNYAGGAPEEIEKTYSTKQIKGTVPDIVFHGTNSQALGSILKFGLFSEKGSLNFLLGEYIIPGTYFLQ